MLKCSKCNQIGHNKRTCKNNSSLKSYFNNYFMKLKYENFKEIIKTFINYPYEWIFIIVTLKLFFYSPFLFTILLFIFK